MRYAIALLVLFLGYAHSAAAQGKEFPQTWIGNWKGQLNWYKGANSEPQKVNMEIRIRGLDSINTYSWQIIYGSETTDNRPYKLIAKDTAKGHWVIDENNGIVLDQFRVGDKFCGAFTVGNVTIVNSYWMENGQLIAEFYSMPSKAISTSGNGTEESPTVNSFKIGSYQKAVLVRQ